MKKIILLLTLLFVITTLTFAQNRGIARGAEPGEFYLTNYWYGIFGPDAPPEYTELRKALFRITENGKKISIQYDADHFAEFYTDPGSVMQPRIILADATSGVVYNKDTYHKNGYPYNSLWTSFDYGKNWIFREENSWPIGYYVANFEGLIYRGGNYKIFKSEDYGYNFLESDYGPGGSEPGLQNGEGFSLWYSSNRLLRYSSDFGKTYLEIPIDEEYVFGQVGGMEPDVYRGGLSGEVYVSSMFPPDGAYKISFSADTGHTFRHVYVCEKQCFNPFGILFGAWIPAFMSDREPGVFYVLQISEVEDTNPLGLHTKVCIDYYRDYGETLVATYCHDLTKDYNNNVGIKEKGEGKGDEVLVYPNPTTGELQVTSYELQVTSIEVFDIYGRKVIEPSLTVLQSYDLTVLQAGIYFVKITTEKGMVTKKIIKH